MSFVYITEQGTILRKCGHLTNEDYVSSGANRGIYLKREGMRKHFEHYEKSLNQEFRYEQTKENLTFRTCFRMQAERLANALLRGADYTGFEWR